MVVLIVINIVAFFIPFIQVVVPVASLLFIFFLGLDVLLLYTKPQLTITRKTPTRLSNSEQNNISVHITHNYKFAISAQVIDELPEQLQYRNFSIIKNILPNIPTTLHYSLTPLLRGVYNFGNTLVYVSTTIGIVQRKFSAGNTVNIACYPAYKQMQRYSLLAISNKLTTQGSKLIRKIGQSNEFEQIKEYVKGDDSRNINWKASARKNQLMTNYYTDEKSQPIYCIINKGRTMQQTFVGLTLLDYAINATLMLSNVALHKKDRAGLITYSNTISNNSFLQATSRTTQLQYIIEILYKQQTNFLEPDTEKLYATIRTQIKQRSLLILFTNFETLNALERELPYLKKIAKYHVLLVIFFENTELTALQQMPTTNIEQVYNKTIASKFVYEKKLIHKALQQNGILTLLTTPQQLTTAAINMYIELKNRLVL